MKQGVGPSAIWNAVLATRKCTLVNCNSSVICMQWSDTRTRDNLACSMLCPKRRHAKNGWISGPSCQFILLRVIFFWNVIRIRLAFVFVCDIFCLCHFRSMCSTHKQIQREEMCRLKKFRAKLTNPNSHFDEETCTHSSVRVAFKSKKRWLVPKRTSSVLSFVNQNFFAFHFTSNTSSIPSFLAIKKPVWFIKRHHYPWERILADIDQISVNSGNQKFYWILIGQSECMRRWFLSKIDFIWITRRLLIRWKIWKPFRRLLSTMGQN